MLEIVKARRAEGVPFKDIAKELGISRSWCHDMYHRAGGLAQADIARKKAHMDEVMTSLRQWIARAELATDLKLREIIAVNRQYRRPRETLMKVLNDHKVPWIRWYRLAQKKDIDLYELAIDVWEDLCFALIADPDAAKHLEEIHALTGMPLARIKRHLIYRGVEPPRGKLALRLRLERRSRGLPQRAVADAMGVPLSRVQRWEDNLSTPPAEVLEWLASIPNR